MRSSGGAEGNGSCSPQRKASEGRHRGGSIGSVSAAGDWKGCRANAEDVVNECTGDDGELGIVADCWELDLQAKVMWNGTN